MGQLRRFLKSEKEGGKKMDAREAKREGERPRKTRARVLKELCRRENQKTEFPEEIKAFRIASFGREPELVASTSAFFSSLRHLSLQK